MGPALVSPPFGMAHEGDGGDSGLWPPEEPNSCPLEEAQPQESTREGDHREAPGGVLDIPGLLTPFPEGHLYRYNGSAVLWLTEKEARELQELLEQEVPEYYPEVKLLEAPSFPPPGGRSRPRPGRRH